MDYKDKDVDTQKRVADFRRSLMNFIANTDDAEVVVKEINHIIQSMPARAVYAGMSDAQLKWIGAQMMLCLDESIRDKGGEGSVDDKIRDELIKTQKKAEEEQYEENPSPSPESFPVGGYFGGQRGGDA